MAVGEEGERRDVQDQTKLKIMFSPASLPLERGDGLDLARES